MLKLLLPVDGSPSAERAGAYVAKLWPHQQDTELHLLNVQPPLSGDIASFVPAATIADFHHEQALRETKAVRTLLEQANISYSLHTVTGPIAETIAQYAQQLSIDQIIMGSRGMSAIGNLLLGSIATKVIHLAPVPVTLVK